ncbi:hypothetical protein BH24ACT5_BH24ACT5_10420 [soil metagenome]
MTTTLDIAVAQPSTVAHDVGGNVERHADAVRSARARVVVFPEMSLTGYEFDAAPLDPSDHRLGTLADACADTGTIALAGAPVAAPDEGASIGVLRFGDGSADVVYRKMWLGDAETGPFIPGREPAVITVDGW